MKLKIGTQLGPYEILAPIGAGGMGEVWKARDTRLGRIVAIKKVKEQHSERFKQEARSVAALNHPFICQLFDIGPDYLVLEYVEGKSLSSPLPEREAVRLAIQIATALEAAHKKGIIHRDLKPGNIMVTDEGSAKLLDFGLAKLYEQDASSSGSPTADFPATQAGAVLGTVAYMSPEQAQGQPADVRSDIFSFGLVLYEMLSGRRAFSGDSNYAIMNAIVKEEPPRLQTSPILEKIVRKCLAKQPSGRYQTMVEIKTALEKVLEEMQSKSSTEPQPSIAVLPFADMSPGKDNEWFGDGLAEEIINALTQIPGLKVIARTSAFAFRGKEQDITKIAEALRVRTILEGSVRKAGNRIRVTAQLIDAADGSHLWSERYDRDMTDVFVIQDEIASAIAGTLQVKFSPQLEIRRNREPNPAAYEAYLKARYLWGKLDPESLMQSKKFFEEAISLDPRFAQAHCGYADYFLFLGATQVASPNSMSVIRKEARKALEIDPSMPEAHAIAGIVAGVFDLDWKETDQCFRRALASDAVPPRVHQWYGWFYLLTIGRFKEAVTRQELGLKADPLNIVARDCLARSLIISGRLPAAESEAKKVLKLDANYPTAYLTLALLYSHQERWAEALSCAEKASDRIPYAVGVLGGILMCMGQEDRAEKLRQKLLPCDIYAAPLGLFYFHLICGDLVNAAKWLERAIEHRQGTFHIASVYFRSTAQWPAIARAMNLPGEAG